MKTSTTKNNMSETDLQYYLDIIKNLNSGDISVALPEKSHMIAEMAFEDVEVTDGALRFWIQTSNVLDCTSSIKIVIDDIAGICDESERLPEGFLGLEVIMSYGLIYQISVPDYF